MRPYAYLSGILSPKYVACAQFERSVSHVLTTVQAAQLAGAASQRVNRKYWLWEIVARELSGSTPAVNLNIRALGPKLAERMLQTGARQAAPGPNVRGL